MLDDDPEISQHDLLAIRTESSWQGWLEGMSVIFPRKVSVGTRMRHSKIRSSTVFYCIPDFFPVNMVVLCIFSYHLFYITRVVRNKTRCKGSRSRNLIILKLGVLLDLYSCLVPPSPLGIIEQNLLHRVVVLREFHTIINSSKIGENSKTWWRKL